MRPLILSQLLKIGDTVTVCYLCLIPASHVCRTVAVSSRCVDGRVGCIFSVPSLLCCVPSQQLFACGFYAELLVSCWVEGSLSPTAMAECAFCLSLICLPLESLVFSFSVKISLSLQCKASDRKETSNACQPWNEHLHKVLIVCIVSVQWMCSCLVPLPCTVLSWPSIFKNIYLLFVLGVLLKVLTEICAIFVWQVTDMFVCYCWDRILNNFIRLIFNIVFWKVLYIYTYYHLLAQWFYMSYFFSGHSFKC